MTYSVDELRSMQLSGNYQGLLFALVDSNSFTRAEAMSRLARFQNESVRKAAIRHLASDPDFNVRAQACVVLRNYPQSTANTDALRKALEDDHRLVRSKAAFALAHLRTREALDDIVAMRNKGVEPDIRDTVDAAIDILSTPDRSETLLELVNRKDVDGIGKLFDCMLKPDHDEIEVGLAKKGKTRMLNVFKRWESKGRLTALDEDPESYSTAKREYARELIEAYK